MMEDPVRYAAFIQRHNGQRYRFLPENAHRALNEKPQVEGLVEGLLDFSRRMGAEFTVSQVSVWFDRLHDQKYVKTKVGAACLFVYYLPELKALGVVEELN